MGPSTVRNNKRNYENISNMQCFGLQPGLFKSATYIMILSPGLKPSHCHTLCPVKKNERLPSLPAAATAVVLFSINNSTVTVSVVVRSCMNGELITTTTASLYQDWRFDCINIVIGSSSGTRTPDV